MRPMPDYSFEKMLLFSYHNKYLPYFIHYFDNGWAFYNRDYANLITGEPFNSDISPKTFKIDDKILKSIDVDKKYKGKPTNQTRIFFHNDDSIPYFICMYIYRLLILLDNNIDPLGVLKFMVYSDNTEKKDMTITGILSPMEVGDVYEFPAEVSMTVRSMASMLGFKWGRRFNTRTDRERRKIIVKRVE